MVQLSRAVIELIRQSCVIPRYMARMLELEAQFSLGLPTYSVAKICVSAYIVLYEALDKVNSMVSVKSHERH